jgi:hypothetical protein
MVGNFMVFDVLWTIAEIYEFFKLLSNKAVDPYVGFHRQISFARQMQLLGKLDPVDLWHDRAVRHFFTEQTEQDAYATLA